MTVGKCFEADFNFFHVAQARAGEMIEITSHDKPVARLIGVPEADTAGIAKLLARGAAKWRGGKPTYRPPLKLSPHPRSMSEMVIGDRR